MFCISSNTVQAPGGMSRRLFLGGMAALTLNSALVARANAFWPLVLRVGVRAFGSFTQRTVVGAGARAVPARAAGRALTARSNQASQALGRGGFVNERQTRFGVTPYLAIRPSFSAFGSVIAENNDGIACAAFFNDISSEPAMLEAPELVMLNELAAYLPRQLSVFGGLSKQQAAGQLTNMLYPVDKIRDGQFDRNWQQERPTIIRTSVGSVSLLSNVREGYGSFMLHDRRFARGPINGVVDFPTG